MHICTVWVPSEAGLRHSICPPPASGSQSLWFLASGLTSPRGCSSSSAAGGYPPTHSMASPFCPNPPHTHTTDYLLAGLGHTVHPLAGPESSVLPGASPLETPCGTVALLDLIMQEERHAGTHASRAKELTVTGPGSHEGLQPP